MLQVRAEHTPDRIEIALRIAAQQHGANVISVTHLGQLLRGKEQEAVRDAVVFTICHPELSAALLAADIRFASFVPCRIAAFAHGDAVILEAMTSAEICHLLSRPDLRDLAGKLDAVLRAILEDASRPVAAHPVTAGGHAGQGATEDQVNARGSIPQRIDCHGTKVEELAGTGKHDSPGG